MKRFLQAAFNITLFQVVVIVILAALKYIFTTYKIFDKMEKPFVWVCLAAGLLLVFAAAITGIIEKGGLSFEEWKDKPKKTILERLTAGFISLGFAIPGVLAYVIFLYVVAPTSMAMVIALFIGMVLKNCITYFLKKQSPQTSV